MNGQSNKLGQAASGWTEGAPRWKLVRYGRILMMMVGLGLLFEVAAALGTNISGPSRVGASFFSGYNIFLGAAFVGALVVYLASRPPRAELRRTLLIGAGLELLLLAIRWWAGRRGLVLLSNAGSGTGLAAIGMLGWRTWSERTALRPETPITMLAAAAIPGFVVLTEPFLEMTAHFHPLTMDGVIYAADGTLGVQGSWVIARALNAVPMLKLLVEAVYAALPAALGWIIALELSSAKTRTRSDLLSVFIVAGVIGFFLYHFYPVAGPMYAFVDQYPQVQPAVTAAVLEPMSVKWIARNCVPSMHTTWALLIFLHSRPFGLRVRLIAGAFLAITLIATVGLGYHYVLDLVVAVPYTMMLQGLFTSSRAGAARWWSVGLGAAMVAGWLVVLREGVGLLLSVPPLTWLLVALTLAASAWLEIERVRALERSPVPRLRPRPEVAEPGRA